ncbi:MAG: NADH-quinone oxidoreductase subunit C [Candidatus Omnitrophica bacterium]|jgi:Ni,Fe-hydrogenase III component G|nr:NADH-quinone oxidoreductase subunit C [Candidatus Omnitrophota bacterium]
MQIKEEVREKLKDKILNWEEKSSKRIYFTIDKEDIIEVVKFLFKDLGLRFSIASGLDTPDALEILYHFSCDKNGEIYSVRVLLLDKKNPQINSITPLFVGVEWCEREIWELLGIKFIGHPNLKRLLLADDWPEGNYPLRHKNEP